MNARSGPTLVQILSLGSTNATKKVITCSFWCNNLPWPQYLSIRVELICRHRVQESYLAHIGVEAHLVAHFRLSKWAFIFTSKSLPSSRGATSLKVPSFSVREWISLSRCKITFLCLSLAICADASPRSVSADLAVSARLLLGQLSLLRLFYAY